MKALGLLKGVGPSSLSEAASMPKLDLLALASRCGDSTTLIEGRWKMARRLCARVVVARELRTSYVPQIHILAQAPHYGGVCAPAFFAQTPRWLYDTLPF